MKLDRKLKKIGGDTLYKTRIKLDCSAFYPSITRYYNFNYEGIPFLRVNEIKGGLINIDSDTAFLPEQIVESNTSTIKSAYPGDIIIAKGGNTLAKVGLITESFPKYALSRDLILLKTNSLIKYNKYFLWVFLHSKFGQQFLWRTASQTGQPHLTLPSIGEIQIPSFSNKFQDAFELLYKKSLFFKGKSNLTYADAEKKLLQTLELENFNPGKAKVNIKSFSESFATSGRLDAEYYQPKYEHVIEQIKKHNHSTIKEVVSIKKSVEPGSSAYSDEGISFLRVADYDKFGIKTPQKCLSDNYYQENKEILDELKPKTNTILFSKDGSVGTAYKLRKDEDLITSGAILHLRVKNENQTLPDYLTLVLNSELVQMQAERDAGGSIILHWRVSEIEKVVVPIIEIEKQKEIAGLIEESFSLKKQSEELLKLAKTAVEKAIEENEESAMNFINEQIK